MTTRIDEIYTALARVPLFFDLDTPSLEAVAGHAQVRDVAAGTVLFQQGDPGNEMVIVLRGCLQVSARAEDGSDLTLGLLGTNEMLGEMALLDDHPRSATVRAIENCELVTLDRETFTGLLRGHPELALGLLRCMVRRLRQTSENATDIAYMDVYHRLAKRLLYLAATNGDRTPEGLRITIPLTVDVLASMIASERDGVERIISHLESEGILTHREDHVVVHDLERLHDPLFPTRIET